MMAARFNFDPGLAPFIAPKHRGAPFDYQPARAATLKNAIEALGVPHTEVGAVTVNGQPATLQRIVRDGDVVEVEGVTANEAKGVRTNESLVLTPLAPLGPLIFLADAHLGGLARFLRMMGFDTLHENALADSEIRAHARDGRIVLTRDRELLKCAEVVRGAYVRALKPEAQLAEVSARFGLARAARPFTLCLRCNTALLPVEKARVAHLLPQNVARAHESFVTCPSCARVYWPGSHYARMLQVLRNCTGE